MRRLYYLAEDLETTEAISEALHEAGITDWNFHVLARDEDGLYRHHIHSATPLHQLDIIHTGERWAFMGAAIGLLVGLLVYTLGPAPWLATPQTVVLTTLVGGLFGAWQGGMVGLTRENYKLAPFHEAIEAGRYLVMVDVTAAQKPHVRELMNMQFPQVAFGGRDTTFVNPFKRPERIYHQTTH